MTAGCFRATRDLRRRGVEAFSTPSTPTIQQQPNQIARAKRAFTSSAVYCNRLLASIALKVRTLQKLAKLVDGQPGITDNPGHRKGIDRVVPRTGENTLSVRKHDMLALACDPKTDRLQHPYRIQMVDADELRHRLRDFDFTYVCIAQQFVAHREVVDDGVSNVRERLRFIGALRPATGQT